MSIRLYKATTSSLRFLKQVNLKNIFLKKKKIKTQSKNVLRKYGRNNFGRITSYHRGGGCKRIYRIQNNKEFDFGFVEGLEYNPYSSAFLARIYNVKTKKFLYQIAPHMVSRGCRIRFNLFKIANFYIGNTTQLSNIPIGVLIHNINFRTLSRTSFSKSAGTYSQIIYRTRNACVLKMMSGELRQVPMTCRGTFGIVSNLDHKRRNYGKAGRKRWLNFRPIVRGVAMNPIDHPHGGGQGKTSAGRPSVSPWGKLTKGVKTRKRTKSIKFLVDSVKKKKNHE